MDKDTLRRLELLNQLSLTEAQKEEITAFFADRQKDIELLNNINTDETERMVHVMPMTNILREDVAEKNFTRDELQEDAPESYDGYWQVPRLVE